jgi:uncharacterized protein
MKRGSHRTGLFTAALLGLALQAGGSLAATTSRVAVVIGNSNYREEAAKLHNAAEDARLIAERLVGIGFSVHTHYNLDGASLSALGEALPEMMKDAEVGLLYFAGHAVQIEGSGYFLPVDLEQLSAEEILEKRIPIARIVQQVAGTATGGLRMVIIDACRNDPFSRLGAAFDIGLNTDEPIRITSERPVETLIAYAASSGQLASDGPPGGHGPYALAMDRALSRPGLTVLEVNSAITKQVLEATESQQIPWLSGTIHGQYWLNPGEGQSEISALDSEEPDLDAVLWSFLGQSGDRSALRRFLTFFPDSSYAARAREQLASLATVERPKDSVVLPEPKRASPGAPIPADLFRVDRALLERVPGGIATSSTACDWLAADFADQMRVTPSVRDGLVQLEAAAQACVYAMRAAPYEPRYAFQLGRVLDLAGYPRWARHFYSLAARQNYAAALTNLGYLELNPPAGEAVDAKAALGFYRAAARLGNLRARTNIGTLYRQGIDGVLPRSDREAMAWYQLASDFGWVNAQNALADQYRRGGDRFPSDLPTAATLYELAALNGQKEAMNNLGRMLITGWEGVEPDRAEGRSWLRRGIAAGSRWAPASLAYDLVKTGEAEDDPEAVADLLTLSWLRRNDKALIDLAALYDEGEAFPRDPDAAFRAARRAEAAGAAIDPTFVARLREEIGPDRAAGIDAEVETAVMLNGR